MPVTLGPAVRAALPLPDVFERGAVNVLRCPLFDASGALTPTSATVAIYDAAGGTQVSATSATITGGVPTYSWTPSATAQLGEGWRVEWANTTASYGIVTVRNPAMMARTRLTCPISVNDLWALEPGLNPSGDDPLTAMTAADFDAKIEEAWIQVQGRLLAAGRRPYLVIGAYSLREVTQAMALSVVFRGIQTRLSTAYTEKADAYHALAEQAWTRVRLDYDTTDDGIIDTGKVSGRPAAYWIGR